MSLIKELTIDDKKVKFKASAAIPRLYRIKFGRDIYKDLNTLEKSMSRKNQGKDIDVFSLEMFENIAYIMAKHADKTVPNSIDEWLDCFNTFSIYEVLPEIIKLWGLNVKTDIISKKKFERQRGR